LRGIFKTKLGKLCHGTGMIGFNRLAFRVRAANQKPHGVLLMALRKGYLMGGNADGVSVGDFQLPHRKLAFRRYQNIRDTLRSGTF
jgi:hypothetical protein